MELVLTREELLLSFLEVTSALAIEANVPVDLHRQQTWRLGGGRGWQGPLLLPGRTPPRRRTAAAGVLPAPPHHRPWLCSGGEPGTGMQELRSPQADGRSRRAKDRDALPVPGEAEAAGAALPGLPASLL